MTRRLLLLAAAIVLLAAPTARAADFMTTVPPQEPIVGVQVYENGAWRYTHPSPPYRRCMQLWKATQLKVLLRRYHGKTARLRNCVGTYPRLRGDLDARFGVLVALNATAADVGRYLYVNQGLRTRAEQERLYNAGLLRYGYPEVRKWVALPGTSRHESGCAVDVQEYGKPWVNLVTIPGVAAAAPRHGLWFPMSWEPWHAELVGCR